MVYSVKCLQESIANISDIRLAASELSIIKIIIKKRSKLTNNADRLKIYKNKS